MTVYLLCGGLLMGDLQKMSKILKWPQNEKENIILCLQKISAPTHPPTHPSTHISIYTCLSIDADAYFLCFQCSKKRLESSPIPHVMLVWEITVTTETKNEILWPFLCFSIHPFSDDVIICISSCLLNWLYDCDLHLQCTLMFACQRLLGQRLSCDGLGAHALTLTILKCALPR